MKILFKYNYQDELKIYYPYATSLTAFKQGISDFPDNTTNFEEEKILAQYLSSMPKVGFSAHLYQCLHSLDIQKSLTEVSSHEYIANIVNGSYIEITYAFGFDDSEDEDYAPWFILPCKEVAYALDKWRDFIQKEISPEYSEIIDTEDVYKEAG